MITTIQLTNNFEMCGTMPFPQIAMLTLKSGENKIGYC